MSASWSVMRFLYFRHKVKYFKSRRHHVCFAVNARQIRQYGVQHSCYTAALSRLSNKNDSFELAHLSPADRGFISDHRSGPASVIHRHTRPFHLSQTTMLKVIVTEEYAHVQLSDFPIYIQPCLSHFLSVANLLAT